MGESSPSRLWRHRGRGQCADGRPGASRARRNPLGLRRFPDPSWAAIRLPSQSAHGREREGWHALRLGSCSRSDRWRHGVRYHPQPRWGACHGARRPGERAHADYHALPNHVRHKDRLATLQWLLQYCQPRPNQHRAAPGEAAARGRSVQRRRRCQLPLLHPERRLSALPEQGGTRERHPPCDRGGAPGGPQANHRRQGGPG